MVKQGLGQKLWWVVMRAMLLKRPLPAGSSPLVGAELPDVEPGADEVLLRVLACGVCRTDLQICEGDIVAHKLPVVPGHQIVARVEAAGSAVHDARVGDCVGVAWLGSACGTCLKCRSGRENLCERAAFTGWDRDGGYATHVVARADFTFPIPPAFEPSAAAPLLCGGVIGYRSLKRSGIRPGQKLGLYGFGASALLAIQVARHWHCRVFVATRSHGDRERALAMGAEWVGAYGDAPPEPLDAAVTFAPSGDVVRNALRALDRGGTVAINAIHLDRVPELPYEELWWERNLCSVANFTRQDAREFLELAAHIPIRTRFETHPLDEANLALQRHKKGAIDGAAVLIP